MHELSIAMNIVEAAHQEALRQQAAKVSAVHLELGLLSGVVKAALLSCYEMACKGTVCEGSQLVIQEIPILVHCPKCAKPQVVDSPQWFVCPQCGVPISQVTQGRQLQIVALEIS